ncbi:unnamed protein product [Camellia sinensis]
MYLWMHNLPQQAFSKLLARRNHSANEAKRHFVKGAPFLDKAKSTHSAKSNSFGRQDETECTKNIIEYMINKLGMEEDKFSLSVSSFWQN